MSSGGFVSGMISSLKNNARKRISLFERKGGFGKNFKSKAYQSAKNATPKELEVIRAQLKKEKRVLLLRTILIIFIATIVVIWITSTLLVL